MTAFLWIVGDWLGITLLCIAFVVAWDRVQARVTRRRDARREARLLALIGPRPLWPSPMQGETRKARERMREHDEVARLDALFEAPAYLGRETA